MGLRGRLNYPYIVCVTLLGRTHFQFWFGLRLSPSTSRNPCPFSILFLLCFHSSIAYCVPWLTLGVFTYSLIGLYFSWDIYTLSVFFTPAWLYTAISYLEETGLTLTVLLLHWCSFRTAPRLSVYGMRVYNLYVNRIDWKKMKWNEKYYIPTTHAGRGAEAPLLRLR